MVVTEKQVNVKDATGWDPTQSFFSIEDGVGKGVVIVVFAD